MMLPKLSISLMTSLFLGLPNYAPQAAQHALVVGINQYPSGTESLAGAVNDAELIAKTLRNIQVQLPKARVLLNSQATRANVIHAWQQMVKQAQRGDTLIFTYAGHGSQQEDEPPLDEVDGEDETLVLYQGILRDDELTELFAQARSYHIVLVADSCHSGGLVIREKSFAGREICRFTTERTAAGSPIPPLHLTTQGDEKEVLQHVTVITAQQSDSQKVCEITEDNQAHGALSYFFAQALNGFADGNQNSRLERSELEQYLTKKVIDLTNRKQQPQLLPQPDDQPVIVLPVNIVRPTPAPAMITEETAVAIRVEGGKPPTGLKYVRWVSSNQPFDLRFVMTGTKVEVFNHTHDLATELSELGRNYWQPIINKQRLLMTLETQFDMRLQPVGIKLREGDRVHQKGELLNFTITPKNSQLTALTLFNLTGNGQLQFLYPLARKQHPDTVAEFPYLLDTIRVISPFGGDNLVAIWCDKPPKELQQLLEKSHFLPESLEVVRMLHQQRCQVGQYAFFTKE